MTEPIKHDLDTILTLKENHDKLARELMEAKSENPPPEVDATWGIFWVGLAIGAIIGWLVPL